MFNVHSSTHLLPAGRLLPKLSVAHSLNCSSIVRVVPTSLHTQQAWKYLCIVPGAICTTGTVGHYQVLNPDPPASGNPGSRTGPWTDTNGLRTPAAHNGLRAPASRLGFKPQRFSRLHLLKTLSISLRACPKP